MMSGKMHLKLEKHKKETSFFLFSWDTTESTGERERQITASVTFEHYSNCLRNHVWGQHSRQATSGYLDTSGDKWIGKNRVTYSFLLLIQHQVRLQAMMQQVDSADTLTLYKLLSRLPLWKMIIFYPHPKNIKAVRVSMMRWLYAEIVLRQQFSIPFLRWIKLPTEIPRFCIHINLCSFTAIYHFNNYSKDSLKLSKAFSCVLDFKLSISFMWHNFLWKLLFWHYKQNHL